MDWDDENQAQRIRDRSMLKSRINPNLLPEEQVIANIFQGPSSKAEGNYPGDSEMSIPNSLSIQVHRVKPIYGDQSQTDVVALGYSEVGGTGRAR